MYFLPTSSSRFQPVSRQNSVPTKQISPVRRQTTVGVPENEMSLLSSTSVRWNVRSTKVCRSWASQRTRAGKAKKGARRKPGRPAHLVFLCQRHLQRDQTWPERGERANDTQNVILVESEHRGKSAVEGVPALRHRRGD